MLRHIVGVRENLVHGGYRVYGCLGLVGDVPDRMLAVK